VRAFARQEIGMYVFRRFLKDESGATAIEYVMIGSLVSIMIILGATTIGSNLHDLYYDKLTTALK